MRGTSRGVALLVAAALGSGCSVDATGFLITLRAPAGEQAQSIEVTVFDGDNVMSPQIGAGRFIGRQVASADSFAIHLSDSADGHNITVQLIARMVQSRCQGQPFDTTHVKTMVAQKHVAVSFDMDFGDDGCLDAGLDGGPHPEMMMPDLLPPPDATVLPDESGLDAAPDLTPGLPDLSSDLSMPDLVRPPVLDLTCDPACANNVATHCSGNLVVTEKCAWGCNGTACNNPTCANPADIYNNGNGGTFTSNNSNAMNNHDGSCAMPMGGKEHVLSFTLTDWTTVDLSMMGSFTPQLYVRKTCANPKSEVVLRSPCTGNAPSPACSGGGVLSLCSLPPGTYYTFADSWDATSGPYSITSAFTPSTLDAKNCSDAGILLGPYPATYTGTTIGHAATGNFASNSLTCGVSGAGNPDAIFWVPVPDGTTKLTLVTTPDPNTPAFKPIMYVRAQCAGNDSCDDGANHQGNPTLVLDFGANPARGFGYFVVVDGQNTNTGNFSLTVTAVP